MQSLLCELTLRVGFSCYSGPDGGLLSDPVAPFLVETIEFPFGWSFFCSLSGSSTVDFFPVFPRAFSPGVVMAPSHGFRLLRFGRLVLLAPRSLLPPSRSTPFARFVTFWLLSGLELLPGVIPLYREHGRGGLRPLNHYLLAQLLFCFCVEYFNCWFEENISRHLLLQVQ